MRILTSFVTSPQKSSPLNFLAVFSATAWNLNAKFYILGTYVDNIYVQTGINLI